jgi:hypothetical protein
VILFAGLAAMLDEGEVAKDKAAELVVYSLFLFTAVCCAVYESDYTGVASSALAAVVAVSVSGVFLTTLALGFDRTHAVVPVHVLDFLVYLWFVLGGLVGASATKGALGVVVVLMGAVWALQRRHSLVLCAALPLLMFWAGASLDAATDHASPCLSVGLPVLYYGLCELGYAAVLRYSNMFNDVALKGPGSVASWANPPDLVPFLLSTTLEVSGALFTAVGGFTALYCPDSDADGSLGLGGNMGFCGVLLFLGLYLIARGLFSRSAAAISTNGLAPPSATTPSSARDAATFSFRFRLAGLVLINGAIWFAYPAAKSVAVRSGLIVAGSLLLLASGCASMYWRKNLFGFTDEAEAPKSPASPKSSKLFQRFSKKPSDGITDEKL